LSGLRTSVNVCRRRLFSVVFRCPRVVCVPLWVADLICSFPVTYPFRSCLNDPAGFAKEPLYVVSR
ncbi:unnamed protein product, partial [Ectocarpus sp. 13 AM-2016]